VEFLDSPLSFSKTLIIIILIPKKEKKVIPSNLAQILLSMGRMWFFIVAFLNINTKKLLNGDISKKI
jgi:hypothetical protein